MESSSVCHHTSDKKKSDDRVAGVRLVNHKYGYVGYSTGII